MGNAVTDSRTVVLKCRPGQADAYRAAADACELPAGAWLARWGRFAAGLDTDPPDRVEPQTAPRGPRTHATRGHVSIRVSPETVAVWDACGASCWMSRQAWLLAVADEAAGISVLGQILGTVRGE